MFEKNKGFLLSLIFLASLLGLQIPEAFAMLPCPTCGGYYSNYGYLPYMQYMPPWLLYGLYYPNSNYPGAWAGAAMNGSFYAGAGGAMMGKPNLYIQGKKDTQVEIKIKLASDSHWLMAVPVHGLNGWKGTLDSSSNIRIGNASFPYLFYDYRSDLSHFQDKRGFCVSRNELIPKLINLLINKGFHENEIRDFQYYWDLKIPPSLRYCIYPQDEIELNGAANIDIKPQATRITRIAFMIVVDEWFTPARALSSAKFGNPPTEAWLNLDTSRPSGIKTTPLELREWGVGFLAN